MYREKQRRISRRDFLRSASAVAALPLIASCGGAAPAGPAETSNQDQAAAPAGEPVKITMWTWYGEQEQEFPKLVEEFNKAQPDIVVENRVYGTDEYQVDTKGVDERRQDHRQQ